MNDNTKRFSDRVSDYVKYRPSYPEAVFEYISEDFGLNKGSVIADIGSGTGIFTEPLLKRYATVFAVEPNREMRSYAEGTLGGRSSFHSIDGTAEHTGLGDQSVDAITVAQAFHWFDLESTKAEFKRILRGNGDVFLVWNERTAASDFMMGYEALLRSGIAEYPKVNSRNVTDEKIAGFIPVGHKSRSFANNRMYTWDELLGRLASSSYTPKEGTGEFRALKEKLKALFDRWNVGGRIEFLYTTEVHSGKMQ